MDWIADIINALPVFLILLWTKFQHYSSHYGNLKCNWDRTSARTSVWPIILYADDPGEGPRTYYIIMLVYFKLFQEVSLQLSVCCCKWMWFPFALFACVGSLWVLRIPPTFPKTCLWGGVNWWLKADVRLHILSIMIIFARMCLHLSSFSPAGHQLGGFHVFLLKVSSW